MTREQLQELKSAASFVADSNRGMFQNTGMEGFQPEPGSMFAERLLRLLLERERLLEAFRRLNEHGMLDRGDCYSETSGEWDSVPWAEAKEFAREAIAFVEEEA